MKVVFATPYLPVPPDFGGARRMYELIRGARQSQDVSTVSLVDPGVDTKSAESQIGPMVGVRVPFTARTASTRVRRMLQLRSLASPRSSQHGLYYSPAFQETLDRQVESTDADLVQFEFSQMGSYKVAAGRSTVLDVHNVEHELLRQIAATGSSARRLFNMIEYRKFRREEIANWKSVTRCIATSAKDATAVAVHTRNKVPVIPNGVDLDFFRPATDSNPAPGSITFVGAMRYRPNAEAAIFFVEEIFPIMRRAIPEAQFTIVGADPPALIRALDNVPGVTVTGTVPDVRPWLQSAQLVVAPLLTGGGTRIKILEAFAVGRPVVATAVGAEGIDVEDRQHLLIANNPKEFAARAIELSNDAQLRARLTENALALVRDRYQWSAIAGKLNDLHTELVEAGSPRLFAAE